MDIELFLAGAFAMARFALIFGGLAVAFMAITGNQMKKRSEKK